jgi:hypothetical protein
MPHLLLSFRPHADHTRIQYVYDGTTDFVHPTVLTTSPLTFVYEHMTVLRTRELLEDLMPVIYGYGSRNSEDKRSEGAKNIEKRHNDPRYRGIGH